MTLQELSPEAREQARQRCLLNCRAPSCITYLTVRIGGRGRRRCGGLPPYLETTGEQVSWLWAHKPGSMLAFVEENRNHLCGFIHAELFGRVPVQIKVANGQQAHGNLRRMFRQAAVAAAAISS